MKTKKKRIYSRYTKEAAILLGHHIQLLRKKRKWTETDLAERAGISKVTLRKIEKGDLSIALGFAFEVAALVGVKLFEAGPAQVATEIDNVKNKIALLPQRIRQNEDTIDDDF